ncbi:MAG: N-acetylmuramoyl-L-alanine amidase [Armatimonadota bacterium]|nr:N-acetylmuramoyl-L-alanine amidase [bacterium]
MKICLDAGHGGADNGTSGNSILEDAWALEFVGRLKHHLHLHGVETVETRTTDKQVALATRAAIAVNAGCDLFLSVHCNGVKSNTADGAEAFYAPVGSYKNNSLGVGRELIAACVEQGLDNRKVKPDNESQHPSLTVLRKTCQHMPAVLLEIGFVTNKHDSDLMKNKVWRDKLAAALALAIVT